MLLLYSSGWLKGCRMQAESPQPPRQGLKRAAGTGAALSDTAPQPQLKKSTATLLMKFPPPVGLQLKTNLTLPDGFNLV